MTDALVALSIGFLFLAVVAGVQWARKRGSEREALAASLCMTLVGEDEIVHQEISELVAGIRDRAHRRRYDLGAVVRIDLTGPAYTGFVERLAMRSPKLRRDFTRGGALDRARLEVCFVELMVRRSSDDEEAKSGWPFVFVRTDAGGRPRFVLQPEGRIVRGIGALLGETSIEFPEDPAFARRYTLDADDEAAARGFFTDARRRFYTEHERRAWIESRGSWLIVEEDVAVRVSNHIIGGVPDPRRVAIAVERSLTMCQPLL